jgi:hypothetical protein
MSKPIVFQPNDYDFRCAQLGASSELFTMLAPVKKQHGIGLHAISCLCARDHRQESNCYRVMFNAPGWTYDKVDMLAQELRKLFKEVGDVDGVPELPCFDLTW